MEDRAIPPGGQAGARHREMPVSLGQGAEEPYWLRDSGMDSFHCAGQEFEDDDLQHEGEADVELHAARTYSAIGADGVHLS